MVPLGGCAPETLVALTCDAISLLPAVSRLSSSIPLAVACSVGGFPTHLPATACSHWKGLWSQSSVVSHLYLTP